MERLDGPLADLVAAEKEDMKEVRGSKDAAWAGIAAAWSMPPPPAGPAGVPEAAAAGKAGVLKVVAALAVGTTVAAGAWSARPEAAAEPVARVAAPRIEAPVDPPKRRPPSETVPVTAPPPPRPPASAEEPAPRPPNRGAEPQLGLAEELALIDAMRKDVAAGRYAKALAGAKKHRASFAKGSLVADRMDLEAAARCGAGDVNSGKALAADKAKRWPRAPISKRLRTLCNLDE